MKAEHFLISPRFAKANNLPVSFIAIRVPGKETKKAVWVYGHGMLSPESGCVVCGRTLTHPGSILLGIGPECLNNWNARDIKLNNITEEDKKRLQQMAREKKVDQWIPKYCIKKCKPLIEELTLPGDHKSIVPALPGGSVVQLAEKPEAIKQAKLWKGMIAITFPYSFETLTEVKTLEGRQWHSEGKYWTADLTLRNVLALQSCKFVLDVDLIEFALKSLPEEETPVKEVRIRTNINLKRVLYLYQKEGLAFIESRQGRALVGDEMGLGKTIQALAYLQLHPELRPAVIVCPASLKLNWAKEIRETNTKNINTQIVEGRETYNLHGDIIIINYDIVTYWLKALVQIMPAVVILDEGHLIKNNSAKRTKAVKLLSDPMCFFNTKKKDKVMMDIENLYKQDLAHKVPHFLVLSGTPIVNKPVELYNAISIIKPLLFPSFIQYAKRYCGAVNNGYGWNFSGATNMEELHKILTETIMIRRKKADVLKELPDKVLSFVPMSLDNAAEYDAIEDDVIAYLREHKGDKAADRASNAEVIVQMEQLKQAAVRGKMKAVVTWIEDFLDSDEKLVVFATHKFVIDKLMEVFGKVAVKIDGSTSMTARNDAVEQFQTNLKAKLFIGNIKAAGVGLTLTAASNVAVIEFPWTPGELQQAIDRCHRIGQKFTVNAHFLMVPGTIEEKIAALLDSKTKILDAVLDGVETKQESLLIELMNFLMKKEKKKLQYG